MAHHTLDIVREDFGAIVALAADVQAGAAEIVGTLELACTVAAVRAREVQSRRGLHVKGARESRQRTVSLWDLRWSNVRGHLDAAR
jgi:hypothetical protein